MQWDEAYEQKLKALTLKDINAVVKKYLEADKFSIIDAGDLSKLKESK